MNYMNMVVIVQSPFLKDWHGQAVSKIHVNSDQFSWRTVSLRDIWVRSVYPVSFRTVTILQLKLTDCDRLKITVNVYWLDDIKICRSFIIYLLYLVFSCTYMCILLAYTSLDFLIKADLCQIIPTMLTEENNRDQGIYTVWFSADTLKLLPSSI